MPQLTSKQKVRFSQWASTIKECQHSGLSVKLWCQQHNVNISTYYFYLNKLRSLALDELEVPAPKEIPQVSFRKLELEPAITSESSQITLQVGGANLLIPESASIQSIENVLFAIKNVTKGTELC